MKMSPTEKLKRELTRKRKPAAAPLEFLSTGCTLLNLACTGKPRGGFAAGYFYWLVGDSTSGKTFLALTCFAEAMKSQRFRNYRIILDQPERGALMDLEKFFGKTVAEKIESPHPNGRSSKTIEEFYDYVDDACQIGKPFIYVLDSHDSVSSEAEDDKYMQQKNARRKGRDVPGSMTDGKAKKNSSGIRQLLSRLEKTNSILIVISQTRDNMNPITARFNPKTAAGGRALKFYSTIEIWSSVRQKIRKRVRSKDRTIGIVCRCDVKKGRITGGDRTVEFPIYRSHGIDDVGANVDYLFAEGHWKPGDGKISAPEFGYKGTVDGLIKKIEEEGREKELQNLVATVWNEIEAGCAVERKRRYG